VIKVDNNRVKITANKGTDLFTDTKGKNHANNAPRTLFQPDGHFIFSAKFSASYEGSPYDGGSLIVYADSDNWG